MPSVPNRNIWRRIKRVTRNGLRDKEALRLIFVTGPIWNSQFSPVEALIPALHSRAIQEAQSLSPISPERLRTKFQGLSEKARWNIRMLKQLPEALTPLAKVLRDIELSGKAWRICEKQSSRSGQSFSP